MRNISSLVHSPLIHHIQRRVLTRATFSTQTPTQYPSVLNKPVVKPAPLASTAATTNQNAGSTTPPVGASFVSVKAYYIARNIDILKVDTKVYGSSRHAYQSKNVTINIDPYLNQHISVFKFGSVVFFNIPESQHGEHLKRIKDLAVASDIPIEGPVYSDDYKIIIHSNLERPSVIKAEHVNIQRLDSNNITIVSTVMAQTVALDYYAAVVEKMLHQFMDLNATIEKSGYFSESPESLYQFIASNNVVITTVLSKLGIFEGSDAAWDNADYHSTWESLRKDFELEFRFKDLSMKIDIVKEDTRFFLEMLHNKKTTNMERVIIGLIALEIVVNVYFHFIPILQ